MSRSLWYAALIVLVILVIVAVALKNAYHVESYMSGFWEVDSVWAREAGIDSAYLRLAPPDSAWYSWTTRRRGYLVMVRDGTPVYNGPIDLAYSSWMSRLGSALWRPDLQYTIKAAALTEHGGADTDDAAPLSADDGTFPSSLTVSVSLFNGNLVMSDQGTVWGIFFKNHETSAVASAMPDVPRAD